MTHPLRNLEWDTSGHSPCQNAGDLGVDLYGQPLQPDPPRQLRADELRRLARLGFTHLALSLAASVCKDCGGRTNGTMHKQLCVEPEEKRDPKPAAIPIRQPWEPRPARRAA